MTLIDPKGGVPYAFGEILPSAHMTTIASQQPRALDVVQGGIYANAGPVVINPDDIFNPEDWTFEIPIVANGGIKKTVEHDVLLSTASQYACRLSDADTPGTPDWRSGIGLQGYVTQTAIANGAVVVFDFEPILFSARLLDDLYVIRVEVQVNGPFSVDPAPTGSSLPWYRAVANNVDTQVGRVIAQEDDPGGVNYRAPHWVEIMCNDKLAANESLQLHVQGETPGSNTHTGLQIRRIRLNFEREKVA